jgi:purine-binding chemotaxis protein CheW
MTLAMRELDRRVIKPVGETYSVFTVSIGGEKLAIPVPFVRTIFSIGVITPVPRSRPSILGLINLRGHILTAIDLSQRLGLRLDQDKSYALAVAIQNKGEDYAFVIDEASEVLMLTPVTRITIPHGANHIRNEFIKEFHCLDHAIISVLEIPAILDFSAS